MPLLYPPLCQVLLAFGAKPSEFALIGSAALILRGHLPRDLGDLDVIAKDSAWELFAEQGEVNRVPPYGSERILIKTLYGEIEIYNEWLGDRARTENLIHQAERNPLHNGLVLPLVPIAEVISDKLLLDREKDRSDLEKLFS